MPLARFVEWMANWVEAESRKAASFRLAASKLGARTAYLRDGAFPAGWCVTHQCMAFSFIASSPPPSE